MFRAPEFDTWRQDNTCSYCGSGNPDEFMRRVEARDVTLSPTDKNYKVYVESDDAAQPFGGPAHKFYFQHLSIEQRKRFVELWNAGLKIHGGFYVFPFFMTRVVKGK